jgi:hypothetical protein
MSQPHLPFMATLNLLDLAKLMNKLVLHDPSWPLVPTKLPFEIPSLRVRMERTLVNTSLHFTFGAHRIP